MYKARAAEPPPYSGAAYPPGAGRVRASVRARTQGARHATLSAAGRDEGGAKAFCTAAEPPTWAPRMTDARRRQRAPGRFLRRLGSVSIVQVVNSVGPMWPCLLSGLVLRRSVYISGAPGVRGRSLKIRLITSLGKSYSARQKSHSLRVERIVRYGGVARSDFG